MVKKNKSSILHLGCGNNKHAGAIGIDINQKSDADIIHDLNNFPYPFKSNSFKVIIAQHIIEHLDNIVGVMEEIHRISKNGALVLIESSHFTSVDAFTDITHKHFLTSRSFDYFIPGTDLFKYQYSNAHFKKREIILGPKNINSYLLRTLLQFINKHMILYESRFAYIFPIGIINYTLEVTK